MLMNYLPPADLEELFWAHRQSVAAVHARLRSFPEGLSEEKARDKQQTGGANGGARVCRFAELQSPQFVSCRVRRQGRVVSEVWSRVVEGDVVLLGPGDVCLADLRVAAAEKPLVVLPCKLRLPFVVVRQIEANEGEQCVFSLAANMLWAGCMVAKGECEAVVMHVAEKCRLHLANPTHPIVLNSDQQARYKAFEAHGVGLLETYAAAAFLTKPATLKTAAKFFNLDFRSPLLKWREPEGDGEEVEEVLVGAHLLPFVPGMNEKVMAQIERCCCVVSKASLKVEDMRRWNHGEIALQDTGSEGPHDPIGVALMRWSLKRLGAKSFWNVRKRGFRCYAFGTSVLADMHGLGESHDPLGVGGDVNGNNSNNNNNNNNNNNDNNNNNNNDASAASSECFFRCSIDEALRHCKFIADANTGKLSDESLEALQRVHDDCERTNRQAIVLGVWSGRFKPDELFKNGTILGVVVFREKLPLLSELVDTFKELRENGMDLVIQLRCQRMEDVPAVKELGTKLNLWPDQDMEAHDFVSQASLAQITDLVKAKIWVLPEPRIHNDEGKFQMAGVTDENEQEGVNTITLNVSYAEPCWSGLLPTAASPAARAWLWAPRDLVNSSVNAIGDKLLFESSRFFQMQPWDCMRSSLFVRDIHDEFSLLFDLQTEYEGTMTRFIAFKGLPSASQASADLLLSHCSVKLFVKSLTIALAKSKPKKKKSTMTLRKPPANECHVQ